MRKSVIRGLVALVVGIGASLALILTVHPPHLHPVLAIQRPVTAGQVLTPADVRIVWVRGAVPPGLLTTPTAVTGERAQMALAPGQTLTAADVARTFEGIPPGFVKVMVPVTAGQSALVQTGQRVDVLGLAKTSTQAASPAVVLPLALHVRVLGIYTSSGGAITTPGTAPGLVALAVTPSVAQQLLPYLTQSSAYWLVVDPQGVYPAD